MTPLVSIIIPTYNRAHLITETLDCIKKQTYTNWECIVVDDGSTDATDSILKEYCIKDSRFKYYKRPIERGKGANACRNYGLEQSKGVYINWFDSDDFMFPEFIEMKVNVLKHNDLDFVISKSVFFEDNDIKKCKAYKYTFDTFKITHYNFVSHKINWLTPDLMVCRNALNNHIIFNEKLKTTAQEYNFFSKLTASTIKGVVIEAVLTGYRQHGNSIESNLKINKTLHSKELCLGYYYTILDLGKHIQNNVSVFLHESIIRRSLDVRLPLSVLVKVFRFLLRINKAALIAYVAYQILNRYFIRKYFLRQYIFQTKWE